MEDGNKTSMKRIALEWWSKSYIVDYVICVVMIVVAGILGLAVSPFKMELPAGENNPTVMYSYKKSTVPTVAAGVIAFGIPLLLFVVWQLPLAIRCRQQYLTKSYTGAGTILRRILLELHSAALGILMSGTIMIFCVNCYKTFAGRYRPHYIARVAAGVEELDGRRSFPSGHSAASFAGLFYLTLWLAGKLRLFHPSRAGETWKIVVCFAPTFAAFFIALTRTRDYYHNFSDIIAGSDIGIISALIGYFCMFPSLLSKKADTPKVRGTIKPTSSESLISSGDGYTASSSSSSSSETNPLFTV